MSVSNDTLEMEIWYGDKPQKRLHTLHKALGTVHQLQSCGVATVC